MRKRFIGARVSQTQHAGMTDRFPTRGDGGGCRLVLQLKDDASPHIIQQSCSHTGSWCPHFAMMTVGALWRMMCVQTVSTQAGGGPFHCFMWVTPGALGRSGGRKDVFHASHKERKDSALEMWPLVSQEITALELCGTNRRHWTMKKSCPPICVLSFSDLHFRLPRSPLTIRFALNLFLPNSDETKVI